MLVSEIGKDNIKSFCREDYDDQDELILDVILPAAKSFIQSYTGLGKNELDDHEDMTVALLVLCAEMYDNRRYSVDVVNLNPLVRQILDLQIGRAHV